MIRPEDRNIVIAVATQMFCARLQFMAEAKQPNGQPKYGYSPDIELCVGEAATLLNRVDTHIAPQERPKEMERRRRRGVVELDFVAVGEIPLNNHKR